MFLKKREVEFFWEVSVPLPLSFGQGQGDHLSRLSCKIGVADQFPMMLSFFPNADRWPIY